MIGIIIFISFKEDTVYGKCEMFSLSLIPVPYQCKLFFSHKGCESGNLGSILGLGRSPGEGNGNPLQFLPGEFHGHRSLMGQ